MARYNEILTGRFNRLLQKLLSMKGSAPAPQLSTDIQTVIPLPLGAEARYLESWELFGGAVAQGAVVAQNSAVRLRNPVGSGVVAVLTRITAHAGGSASISQVLQHGPIAVDLANVQTPGRLDARGRIRPTLIMSGGNNVASFGAVIENMTNPTGLGVGFVDRDNQEITLLPGDAMQVLQADTNLALTVNWRWRERALEESELT